MALILLLVFEVAFLTLIPLSASKALVSAVLTMTMDAAEMLPVRKLSEFDPCGILFDSLDIHFDGNF